VPLEADVAPHQLHLPTLAMLTSVFRSAVPKSSNLLRHVCAALALGPPQAVPDRLRGSATLRRPASSWRICRP
jgi:hypothetical protein